MHSYHSVASLHCICVGITVFHRISIQILSSDLICCVITRNTCSCNQITHVENNRIYKLFVSNPELIVGVQAGSDCVGVCVWCLFSEIPL